MREIRFRAWNDKLEEFCYAGPKESDIEGFGIFFDWVERWNLPLMQYTGLKDKNGKEIYEGDIIDVIYYHDSDDESLTEYSRHTVVWGDDYPAFDLDPLRDTECNGLQEALVEYSVIVRGNIYESGVND